LRNGETEMKEHFKSCILLIVIMINVFVTVVAFFPTVVSATWVEGDITQDVVWKLVDSPFIVVGNITVHAGATLRIEPGVEVKFGGPFRILVEGKLVAEGTQDKVIAFTSNNDEASHGDWMGILFDGNEPSMLEYCVVEYAINGTSVRNGDVEVKNSTVRYCSQNGIVVIHGNVTVQSANIVGNLQNGVIVSGNGHVEIVNNEFRENENGILLTGESVSNVDIRNNKIMLSVQKGIQLDADSYSNVNILYNTLTSNYYGFYISGDASTVITNNSVAYNTFGFYYENIEQNHEVHFNDIYGNEMGMDVTIASNATDVHVNAERNYWGDKSGPYHESLNPEGKGNAVGGNGVNLDFIPFLTANIAYINERPTAVLLVDKSLVAPSQTVLFIATLSSDEGRVDYYFYDFGDGTTSGWTSLSVVPHNYSSVGEFTVRLRVMDDFGVESANVSKVVVVQDLTPLEVSLETDSYAVDYGENVSVTVRVTDGGVPVGDAHVELFSVSQRGGGSFLASSGTTNSSGYFTTVLTAPETTYVTHMLIVATASKDGYADGSEHFYIDVIPPLVIEANAEPSIVKSEGTADINVRVTYDGDPVADVTVSAVANNGSFAADEAVTDAHGECTFAFTAPLTITSIEVTMNFTATKEGYLPGSGQLVLPVEPKTLVVEVSVDHKFLFSEATSNVRVHVKYEDTPIFNATVKLSSLGGGNFSEKGKGLTNEKGEAIFVFTAPQVNEETDIVIRAVAEKAGYAPGEGNTTITVAPGVLEVQVKIEPSEVGSEGESTVTVTVTCNGTAVQDVLVTPDSSSSGVFSPNSGTTNEEGTVVFTFTAPPTAEKLNITITVTASKNGYTDGQAEAFLIVNPEISPGGFVIPWEILLVLIIVIVVVVIVVLVKLKVITISWGEEGEVEA